MPPVAEQATAVPHDTEVNLVVNIISDLASKPPVVVAPIDTVRNVSHEVAVISEREEVEVEVTDSLHSLFGVPST